MSSWTPATANASSSFPRQDMISNGSPGRRNRNVPNLDRPLPPVPQSHIDYEVPTLHPKPRSDPTNSAPLKHTRSFSHPFPSFFGGRKSEKKITRQGQNVDTTDDDNSLNEKMWPRSPASRNVRGNAPATSEKQPATGNCITCGSSVKWPQELKVYRCSICVTINDLEPYAGPPPDPATNGAAPHFTTARKPVPLSVHRTRILVDLCITDYLESLLDEQNESPYKNVVPPSPSALFPTTPPRPMFLDSGINLSSPRPVVKPRSPSDSSLSPIHPSRNGETTLLPGHAPEPVRASSTQNPRDLPQAIGALSGTDNGAVITHEPHVQIFRNVESYIHGSFTGCSALNASFFTVRPQPSRRPEAGTHISSDQGRDLSPSATRADIDPFSELDAKTLLLGDVAENASWWLGEQPEPSKPTASHDPERPTETWRGIVSAKTPRINWAELAHWYHAIIHAGESWRDKWRVLQPKETPESTARSKRWHSISIEFLRDSFAESQTHLQRALLKATENLLKRPGRPLSNPEDCRFLLMLLANPLLHPSSGQPFLRSSTNGVGKSNAPKQSLTVRHDREYPQRRGALGHHSGIIKRILGLLGNLTNDNHQFLVAWVSRYSDAHFQRTLDLVGAFVTYRLSRQPSRRREEHVNPTAGLVPSFSDSGFKHPSELHAALELRPKSSTSKEHNGRPQLSQYSEDWQIKAAARFMALLFAANLDHQPRRRPFLSPNPSIGESVKQNAHARGQIVPISNFYNTVLDYADLLVDFEAWENSKTRFTFCQYPFFLSIHAKILILEHDAKRQMEIKAREAFFDSILSKKAVSQFLVLKIRRECLVEDSLRSVSQVIGTGADEIKKGLKIDFVGEEGVDAGGLRKEWFLLLVREIFDPHHGLFVYDEDSRLCYFNPFCFESSEQFFLVGVLLGLAIYNSAILDVPFPCFVFRKLLASAPPSTTPSSVAQPKTAIKPTLEDLAEFRPALASGLRQLLEYQGDVQTTFCRDFVIETDRYGELIQVPLCTGGEKKPVTNSNRKDFVDLYVHHVLETSVSRQYEPFRRGFFTVCGGNALSLFRPEEIELLVRGSDEPLDVTSLRAVSTYEGWPKDRPPDQQPQVCWFWDFFERVQPGDQRKILSFITGSDRIPAMGATNLNIRVALLRQTNTQGQPVSSPDRYPSARTCFNIINLYAYDSRQRLEEKVWQAVQGSEGFGLK